MERRKYTIQTCSKTLFLRRVENATVLNPFLNTYRKAQPTLLQGINNYNAFKEQPKPTNTFQTNINLHSLFKCPISERTWVVDVLQDNDLEYIHPQALTHIDIPHILHSYKTVKKQRRFGKAGFSNQMYYSVGLFCNMDKYPLMKKTPFRLIRSNISTPTVNISRIFNPSSVLKINLGIPPPPVKQITGPSIIPITATLLGEKKPNPVVEDHIFALPFPVTGPRKRTRKFKDDEAKKKWEDMMTLKRKKVFTSLVKKEVGKQHRSKTNKHKEMLLQCRRVALQCQRVVRQKAFQSARIVKEQQWRMKRLSRENLAYWKRSKRVDREIRKKMEKEAEEQRKIDIEFIEAKRQQRKLNFLITQTELYAHFMSRKVGTSTQEQVRILSQLNEVQDPRLAYLDEYDFLEVRAAAWKNAEDAFYSEKARTKDFDLHSNSIATIKKAFTLDGEYLQPLLFRGNLKGYQLRGMNWLANLYAQGLSGILADEMGLGKTVQSIAFLCHIAEKYSVWGPFLIISPASTLHNWQQELAKFVPDFKVVPYWGSPTERRILRQFWVQRDMHTKDSSFHVVITSYQIIIADIKYFNRIKWQYMILDEAQAIKSTNSMRWKVLLGFSCRNRLLLSGTPIQNSMAELWALLHFIMPTLFDSHDEFNEWFSKDIESHAENKTGIDEKHLSRLHMILKPFMLRRIKKDVENELSDKIEIMVYCPLNARQRLLYMAIKQKIQIEDLLHYTVGGGDSHTIDKNFTTNLMNLVMQFRKVCNHPELFERRDVKSPLYMQPHLFQIPSVIYDLTTRKRKNNFIKNYLLFTAQYIHEAPLFKFNDTVFNFAPSLSLSSYDLSKILSGDTAYRWHSYYQMKKFTGHYYHLMSWSQKYKKIKLGYLHSLFRMSLAHVNSSRILKEFVFANATYGRNVIYTHTTHSYYSMPETTEHKNIRIKAMNAEYNNFKNVICNASMNYGIKNFFYYGWPLQIFQYEKTSIPSFLFCVEPKVETVAPDLYCYSRKAAWDWEHYIDDYSCNSVNNFWNTVTENNFPETHHIHTYSMVINPFDIITLVADRPHIVIPDKESLVTDSGKLFVLDGLLRRLKEEGHRVLIYSQMTKMIDLLEEYMWHRHHTYMRLDGSSKISDRRDMVADFQARADIFVFLLSTRAGGLGINLTAADTVIFYDSDWNPTVDQQAMDRAHRLGQTKQVTVYRLICKGSIEERILQRAREKSEIQKLVISGGSFKPDSLKPKEVVSLLLDDEEIEQKYRQRTEERKHLEDMRELEKKRKYNTIKAHLAAEPKKLRLESPETIIKDPWLNTGQSSPQSDNLAIFNITEDVNDGCLIDIEEDSIFNNYTVYNIYGTTVKPKPPIRGTAKRGRPRGSRRASALGRFNSSSTHTLSVLPSELANPNASPSSGSSGFGFPTSSTPTPCRRGPGRPRTKPIGPTHTGTRGPYRPRRPARPLPVPLHTDVGIFTTIPSSDMPYCHLFDFLDQPPSDYL